jgi:ADP-ribose pyrophosphatase YjhB (NUDIX family)
MTGWKMWAAPLFTPIIRQFWRFKRGMTLGVRVLVRRENGDVFLVRHTYTPGWHLPGGGVERGEGVVTAAIKELREEAGLEPGGALSLFAIYRNPNFVGDHIALFVGSAGREVETDSHGEIAERGWFALDTLPEGTTASTRRRIAEVTQEKEPTPDW